MVMLSSMTSTSTTTARNGGQQHRRSTGGEIFGDDAEEEDDESSLLRRGPPTEDQQQRIATSLAKQHAFTIMEGDDEEEDKEAEEDELMDDEVVIHQSETEESDNDPAVFLGDLLVVEPGDFPVQVHDDTESSSSTTANHNNNAAIIVATAAAATTNNPATTATMLEDHSNSTSTTSTTLLLQRRKKKRGRMHHLAKIQDISSTTATTSTGGRGPNNKNHHKQLPRPLLLLLPANQYECQLIRRPNGSNDTALGMKLNIVETGDVVVQHVTPLNDGTASPAIHTGKIRRGDILLMIDGKTLAGGNALSVLNMLKNTNQTMYTLRLAAGEGLRYLRHHSGGSSNRNDNDGKDQATATEKEHSYDPASEMLGLFPMVDQLSGMPLFDENIHLHDVKTPQKSNAGKKSSALSTDSAAAAANTKTTTETTMTTTKRSISDTNLAVVNEHISAVLADSRRNDRDYFLLEWLRSHQTNADLRYHGSSVATTILESHRNTGSNDPQRHNNNEKNNNYAISGGDTKDVDIPLTLAQRQALGRQAMIGAITFLAKVTALDHGKDNRSFHSWNTTLSLYSRASTRRKRIFDAASLPLGSKSTTFGRLVAAKEEDEDDEDNDADSGTDVGVAGSTTSSQQQGSGQLDGDALLLRLAARDEIWRSQVIEFLDNVAREALTEDDDNTGTAKKQQPEQQQPNGGPQNNPAVVTSQDMDAALSNELGSFLFGENMTKILAKHKTPRALPPEEVTAVLFDLATRLSATVPDEIKAAGSLMISPRISLTPFEEKQKDDKSEFMLATRFLLDNALPAWLKTFRPLAWEHRRMLWPVDQVRGSAAIASGGGSSSLASSISDDDLTLDSTGSQLTATASRKRTKKKDLREIVEERELNIETRGET
jgi:hypothetical protein